MFECDADNNAAGNEVLVHAAGAGDMVVGLRLDGQMYYVSASVAQVLGYSDRDFTRLYNHTLEYSDDRRFTAMQAFFSRQLEKLRAELRTGCVCEPEILSVNHRDGFRISLNIQCIASVDANGELRGVVCVCREISHRKAQLDDIALGNAMFDNRLFGVYITDAQGRIIQVNNTFCRITGYTAKEVVGQSLSVLDVQSCSQAFVERLRSSLDTEDYWEGELQQRNKAGEVINAWVELRALRDTNHQLINMVGYFTDLGEGSSAQVKRLAFYDPLTGLPNRSLFTDRLLQACHQSHRVNTFLCLIVLDLRGFAVINQTHGHSLGDALIQAVARRLLDQLRAEDSIGRLGSDRFAVIVQGLADCDQAALGAMRVAQKLSVALREPLLVRGKSIEASADMGIACYPFDGSETTTLMRCAEDAMLAERSQRHLGYRFYSKPLQQRLERRQRLERELFTAFREGQFALQYQPIMSVNDAGYCGCEALLRWNHPQRGLLPASEFIGHLNDTGLIQPVGNWVILQACEDWRRWKDSGVQDVSDISINISETQLRGKSLFKSIHDAMTLYQVPMGVLKLELPEDVFRQAEFRDALEELQCLGVVLLVDGYGRGDCAIGYLNQWPVEGVKLDYLSLSALEDGERRRLMKTLVAVANAQEMQVTVVGVENAEQCRYASDIGIHCVQGYWVGYPSPNRNLGGEQPLVSQG